MEKRLQLEDAVGVTVPLDALLIDALPQHVAVLDTAGTVRQVNAAWTSFARQNGGDASRTGVGVNYLDVCRTAQGPYAEQAESVASGIRRVLDGASRQFIGEYACSSPNEERWFLMSATSLCAPRVGAVVVHTDITDRKRAESNVESANRARRALVATVSHDIRTPLNILLGYCEMLADSDLDETQRDLVLRIDRSSRGLLDLVEDLVDLARIDAGRFQIDIHEIDLVETIQQVVDDFGQRAAVAGIELRCDIGSTLPRRCMADPKRLRQVLNNLLGNAIKFTEKGTIHVDGRLDTDGPDASTLRCEVRDSGIGIAEAEIERLFEPFAQVDADPQQGAGLGLAICRSIIGALGGTIGARANPGGGSTFWFTMPLLPVASASQRLTGC